MRHKRIILRRSVQNSLDLNFLSLIRIFFPFSTGSASFLWKFHFLLLRNRKKVRMILHLLFFKCLQLKIVNMPEWHIFNFFYRISFFYRLSMVPFNTHIHMHTVTDLVLCGFNQPQNENILKSMVSVLNMYNFLFLLFPK